MGDKEVRVERRGGGSMEKVGEEGWEKWEWKDGTGWEWRHGEEDKEGRRGRGRKRSQDNGDIYGVLPSRLLPGMYQPFRLSRYIHQQNLTRCSRDYPPTGKPHLLHQIYHLIYAMVASSDGVGPNGTRFNMANGNASTDANHGADTVTPEPIAICGMGLRLPGGVRDGDSFWELLINGRDARGEVPSTRFAVEGFDDSLSGQGALPTKNGYFLEDDLSRIDTSFFSVSKAELEWCDPQQRLLLEVVRECLDDAGEVNYRGQPVGCYVGTFGQDWYDMTMRDTQNIGGHTLMGCGDLVLANRVSYEFDLHGPR